MAQTILLKRSAVAGKVPTTSDVPLGSLAVNTYDGKLYTKKSVSGVESIVEIGALSSFSAGTTGLTPSTATTGAVTLGGTLAVANGGTGVTSSTGSGSNVLSTSPTLVTPVLGTPTSGTLTNCTGYTFANVASKPTTLSGYGITDAASSTHTHGNITNAGAIGATANLPIITTTSGVLTTGSFGTAANTFCQGNDARLSDTRTPTDGTVTDAKVAANAAIADTKLATIATAGKVSNSATTATNANTASAIVARDASGNFSAGTITAALSGNASTATTLQTARTINGTSFNGSANITTASWGTARSITIGNTTKSVDGSVNVSWSLAEIGASGGATLSGGTITGDYANTSTGYFQVSTGTTAQRPTGANGYLRYNTTLGCLESFVQGIWQVIANNALDYGLITTAADTTFDYGALV